MITRIATTEDIDDLYVMRSDHINASALCRRALGEEREVRGVDLDDPHTLVERTQDRAIPKKLRTRPIHTPIRRHSSKMQRN
jgi:hypothetical protein